MRKRRERDWASRFYLSYAFGICVGAAVGLLSGSNLAGGLSGAAAGTAALLIVRWRWLRRARTAARSTRRPGGSDGEVQPGTGRVDPPDPQRA
jgi:hypothetical protein